MITLAGVSKTYARGARTIQALAPTDLVIEAGAFVIVLGRSGAGKSTLLGIAGGLLRPSTGDVHLKNQSLWTVDDRVRALCRARDMGFVFQNASVIPSLTLLENVMLAHLFLPAPAPDARGRAQGLLDDVGLGDRAHATPDQISGGEKRRLAVASALMNRPAVLLADEPTGELDADTEARVMQRFQQAHARGTTILMVTHNRDLTSYAQRVLVMEQGRLVE
jgi:ABC-type lipoprotein export system ATPase subunit